MTTNTQDRVASEHDGFCDFCQKYYASCAVVRDHKSQIHVGLQCHWGSCAITTTTEAEMRDHVIQHNNDAAKAPGEELPFTHFPGCRCGGDSQVKAYRLKRHLMRQQYHLKLRAEKAASRQEVGNGEDGE
ncbi:Uu.00g139290.m01.CDS01 [Anthostomella pinea]|uniref:Uu.00g139290.m01.CDS01 n=1 Tax=Anthostomella pinea TaxID=933095 RepID=A0AAI8VPV7_9PEZI|nr:Uu.00g139290.m01.CDS01 [Anthostomella pinea]